ncbi:hypothetical protein QFZ84_000497 [Pseudomonas fluorescens]|jgi:hypothetical protein
MIASDRVAAIASRLAPTVTYVGASLLAKGPAQTMHILEMKP